MMRKYTFVSPFALVPLVVALVLGAATAVGDEPAKSDGTDVGITIMGAIVQKNSDDNVALIKESNGKVEAVKKDHIILAKYKVVAVHAEYIELVTRDNKRLQVYQDKFSASLASKKAEANAAAVAGLHGMPEQYSEEGFERVKGKISMTAMYRDKLIKEDLAKVLMQATAEPYMENNAIVGFKMTQIDSGSIYAKAGIANGDIITAVNGADLNSVAGAIGLMRSLKGADHLEVEVRRGGETQKIQVDVK